MRDKHLRDFVAVVEGGSLRAGARLRGVTPAAISRNLVALERDCGVPLLSRTNHGIALTEAGRVLLRRARVVAEELRKAQEEIAALSGGGDTRVTIAISNVAEALLLSRAIEKFMPRFPKARVRIVGASFSEAVRMLREGQIDFVVGTTDPATLPEDLSAERLLSVDLVVTARKAHPLMDARQLCDLADCEWLLAGREAEHMLATAFGAVGLPAPRCRIERGSILAMFYLLVNSDRLSLATQPTIQIFCDAGLLGIVPLQLDLEPLPQFLTTAARRPMTLAAEALATEFMRASRGYRR